MSQWHSVCELEQILPATGVCALVKGTGSKSTC